MSADSTDRRRTTTGVPSWAHVGASPVEPLRMSEIWGDDDETDGD